MELIKMAYYLLVKNLILAPKNGKLHHHYNFQGQQLLSLNMGSTFTFLEDIQAIIIVQDSLKLIQMEILVGENCLFACIKVYKDAWL
jgi:nitric oxide reductase large subunit